MNARSFLAPLVAVALVSLTACSTASTAIVAHDAFAHAETAGAGCNLTVEWDPGMARYEADYVSTATFLSAAELPRTRYVASDSCNLADIVRWQELRAARSQPSDVCQIAWWYDELGQVDTVACVTVQRVS